MTTPQGEPLAAWSRTTARCEECGEVYDGPACPNCGQLAEASPVDVVGFVTERDGQHWLSVVENHRHSATIRATRALRPEQVEFLRRQGDVR